MYIRGLSECIYFVQLMLQTGLGQKAEKEFPALRFQD